MKYLKITLHDNDFCCELEFLGKYLEQIYKYDKDSILNLSKEQLKFVCSDLIILYYKIIKSFNYEESIIKYIQTKLKIDLLDDVDIINNDKEDLYLFLSKASEDAYYWLQ